MERLDTSAAALLGLYRSLLGAWNERDAASFAALFTRDGSAVGFDGSQMNGPGEIAEALGQVFAHHQTACYVAIVRELRMLRSDIGLVRATVGMVPRGAKELNAATNAIQSMIAVRESGALRIALLQNTPAAFHGRPELGERLTRELVEVVRAGETITLHRGDSQ